MDHATTGHVDPKTEHTTGPNATKVDPKAQTTPKVDPKGPTTPKIDPKGPTTPKIDPKGPTTPNKNDPKRDPKNEKP